MKVFTWMSIILLVLVLDPIYAQVFSENFGTLTNGTNISTANTAFDYVRVGSGGGGITATDPNCLGSGSGSAMQLGGSSSSSLNGVGIQSSLGGSDFIGMNLTVQSADFSAGDLFIGAGTGSTFTGNGTFSTSTLLFGIQFDNGNLEYRTGSWNSVGFTAASNTDYFIQLAANSTGAVINYMGGTIADGTMDILINGVLVADDIAIADNALVAGFRIYQINGSMEVCIDDVKVWTDEADINAVLPIRLNNLTGFKKEDFVQLIWQTASEQNNSHFLIQRSLDGRTFETIGRVEGKGDSNEQVDYSFVDPKPAAGLNYYRLQQFDFDGTNAFFGPVSVRFDGTETTKPQVWPVPATDVLQVELPAQDASWNLEVFTINGQLLLDKVVTEKGAQTSFDISALPAGSYFLRWANGREMGQIRFVKQ